MMICSYATPMCSINPLNIPTLLHKHRWTHTAYISTLWGRHQTPVGLCSQDNKRKVLSKWQNDTGCSHVSLSPSIRFKRSRRLKRSKVCLTIRRIFFLTIHLSLSLNEAAGKQYRCALAMRPLRWSSLHLHPHDGWVSLSALQRPLRTEIHSREASRARRQREERTEEEGGRFCSRAGCSDAIYN